MDGTLPAGARHDLTDEQWAILAPLLSVGGSRAGVGDGGDDS
ncbi:transposase [Geodermatophilus sp. URMC 65]